MSADKKTPILDAALAAHAVGINVLPIEKKIPAMSRLPRDPSTGKRTWRIWGSGGVRQSRENVERLFAPDGFMPEAPGLALIGGAVSAGLVLFDFDDDSIFQQFSEKMRSDRHGGLLKRLEKGFHVRTPNGHRLAAFLEGEGDPRGEKWAKRVVNDSLKAVIELKAEGGYAVVAPSRPGAHPSGRLYEQVAGAFETIPRITEKELSTIRSACCSFSDADAVSTFRRQLSVGKSSYPPLDPSAPPVASGEPDDPNPYNDFDARVEWASILEPAGWMLAAAREGSCEEDGEDWIWVEELWRRPGKNEGHSATANHNGDGRLFVFSSSTIFESWEEEKRSYLPHEAWAMLAGLSESESFEIQTALRAAGYGMKLK